MTESTWQTIGVIAGLAFGVVTVYFLVKSNIREQVRQREIGRERDRSEARAPLIAENAQLSGQVGLLRLEMQRRDDVHREEIARKDDRITELEDRLWKRGTS